MLDDELLDVDVGEARVGQLAADLIGVAELLADLVARFGTGPVRLDAIAYLASGRRTPQAAASAES